MEHHTTIIQATRNDSERGFPFEKNIAAAIGALTHAQSIALKNRQDAAALTFSQLRVNFDKIRRGVEVQPESWWRLAGRLTVQSEEASP